MLRNSPTEEVLEETGAEEGVLLTPPKLDPVVMALVFWAPKLGAVLFGAPKLGAVLFGVLKLGAVLFGTPKLGAEVLGTPKLGAVEEEPVAPFENELPLTETAALEGNRFF